MKPLKLLILFLPVLIFMGGDFLEAASPSSGPRPIKYLEVEKGPFLIKYPQGENILQVSDILLKAQKKMESRYGYNPPEKIPIIFYATSKDFHDATGKPAWMAAVARQDGLHFQPTRALHAKGSLSVVITHEYTHWVQNYLTNYRCPHWLAEGLAVLESGEGVEMEKEFSREKNQHRPNLKQIEQDITNSSDQKKVRLAYFRAYQFSAYLEHQYGIKKVAQLLRTLGEGKNINTASQEVFGQSLEAVAEKWRTNK